MTNAKHSILSTMFLVLTMPLIAAEDGEAVYNKACKMCHTLGVAGAPKLGDKTAWKDRIAKGAEKLNANAINGFKGKLGVMPPKGGTPALSDEAVKAAVAFMMDAAK